MKTTLELPDQLFRRVKATAAERGQSLKDFVTDALWDKLRGNAPAAQDAQPAWMQGFGKLKHLRRETARIQAEIDEEFGAIEPEDRA